jgi:hypothetical protein
MEINWTEIIILLINAILVPFALLALNKLGKFLDEKAGLAKSEATTAYLRSFNLKAMDALRTAVTETTQTYVDNIKDTEGWNAEAQKEALRRSGERFKQLMGISGLEMLASIESDVEAWITAHIEALVKSDKWND